MDVVILVFVYLVLTKIMFRLSQTLRRELEHFDTQMEDEFDETFKNYHKQYTASLEYGGIDTSKYK